MMEYILPKHPTLEWLRSTQRQGPSLSLAKHIESTVDWDQFSFKTFGHNGLTTSDLTDFATGGKASGADDALMDFLANSDLTVGALFVVEDWRATPASKFLKDMNLPALFVDEEVYFIVRERDPRKLTHWRRMFSNTVPTFHAFLFADDPRLVAGALTSFELVCDVARNLRAVVCGAYDGESYVLAIRDSLSPRE